MLLAPDIATARLLLTPLSAADAEALFAYRALAEVCRYQSWKPSRLGDAIAFIEQLQPVEFNSPGTWFQLGIRLKESQQLVGDLGVHFLDDGRQVEIGFTLAPTFQGRGLGTEAVRGLLGCLFERLGKHRVFALVDPRNHRSVRLLQRVGMRQEAASPLPNVGVQDDWTGHLVFTILATEWRARVYPARHRLPRGRED